MHPCGTSSTPADPRAAAAAALPDAGPRVAVIGAGISGLAAACRLLELRPDCRVTLFEAAPRIGGVLRTERRDGYLVEQSADNFLTEPPDALELARRIGFDRELLETHADRRRAFVALRGRMVEVPAGFSLLAPSQLWPILTSPLLSLTGRLRLACEPFVPARREAGDESVADFARRRLGRQAYARLVQPLVGGIYTADPERLSLLATLPRFSAMERHDGSLWRGVRRVARDSGDRGASGARYGMFVAPREGLSSLVAAIAARLPQGSIQCSAEVARIERTADSAWRVVLGTGVQGPFEALVVATPAPRAAKLLRGLDSDLGRELEGIEHASSAVAILAYDLTRVARPPRGFGCVVPHVEGRRVLAASFSSLKFPGRAPDGKLLVRVFLGGALQPEVLAGDDAELLRLAAHELAELLAIEGDPEWAQLVRWPQAMPLYYLGHLERIGRIERAVERWPGLALAGNAYRGVGVPQCIASGERAAAVVAERLRGVPAK